MPKKPPAKPKRKKKQPDKPRKGGRPRTRTKVRPKLPMTPQGRSHPESLLEPPLTLENIDHYKFSNCKYYEACLNYAAKCGWSQFHCRKCKTFQKDPHADRAFKRFIANRGKL